MGKNSDMLKTTLGSCVGIILYSIKHRTGGIAHILLGEPPQGKITHKGKYARTAIYTLLAEFESMGILSKSVKACLFGGATMFISKNGNTLQNIGIDNVRISKEVLAACNIPIFFEDTGGTKGRSVSLYVDEGKISYTTSGIENYIYIS
jgi:chemotaxis protein CheD